jgi:mannose-1-phosphate guanylyltransferase
MKAVILVGGEGTRLRPLTCNIAKAMVPVLNTPFLEYVIRHLARHQIKDIVLAQGHLAQPIEDYLGDGSQFGVRLYYSIEDTPLGTAGAVKNAARYLDEAFLMLNGDIFTDLDITTMKDFHRRKKAKATIATTPVDDPTAYGLIETDVEGRITRFLEKPSLEEVTTNMINAGTYILEPDILAQIPPRKEVSIERKTFQQLLTQGEPMYAYSSSAYWLDIGTPEKYLKLHHDLLLDKALSLYSGNNATYGVQISSKSTIHPSTEIKGPVLIGEGCVIERDVVIRGPAVLGPQCKVAEGAIIEGAILWHHSEVNKKALLRNCIVASHSCIQEESQILDNCVLGDNVVVGRNNKLAQGIKIWPDRQIEPDTIFF